MTRVMGIDYSSRFVDCVTVPFENDGSPIWTRFPLTGIDAFERTRSVADSMPGRNSLLYDDVIAVGIEHPGGHHGTRDMLRIQGAILSCLPARLLVEPWPPSKWRKANGLLGNASKRDVALRSADIAVTQLRRSGDDSPITPWPEDAHDAHLIALATRHAITRKQAA